MAYVSLYRKLRPQTFADIIGQDHVVGTLVNAIQTGQVHHALLFTGTRGTGKTSTARILAKALNCERGPTPEPDNTCEQCLSITAGTNLDVVEIDAASHGSVDDTRDLREKASYAPAAARNKVYIIDEAHMVTPQGFNAMLKVLEEPPEHVRFVFCTTEPQKVIEAIRSRCQQHDFRRVRAARLVEHFTEVCAAEGVEADQAALEMVARAADGSVRDGQSRLDQVLTFVGDRRVRLEDVAQVLGVLPVELRFELAEALAAHRVGDVFATVERVADAGHDLHQFAREALEHARDLYVMRVAPDSTTLVDATPETRERLAAQAERFGPGELGRVVRILGDLFIDLRTATDQRLALEVGLARAALPEASLDADALLARIERLERRLAIGTGEPAGHAPAEPRSQTEAAAAPARARQAADAEPRHRAAPSGPGAKRGGEPPAAREPRAAATGESPGAAAGESPGAAAEREAPGAGARRSGAGRAEAGEVPGRGARPSATGDPPDGGGPRGAGRSRGGRKPAADEPEAGDWAAPAPPAAPVDLDLVVRSWPLVLEKVRAASRVVATFLDHGRPVALEGRQLVVEFPAEARFYADALGQEGRNQRVDVALDAVLGGNLEIRIRVGKQAGTGSSDHLPAGEPIPAAPPEPAPAEFEVDPDNDAGEVLDADADARAVADWAAQQLGGEVIEERPNEAAAPRRGPARKKSPKGKERGSR
ncbi:MAG TPA: DNA polymerase III subunit gamma/tau [Actinomycetes bacterium]